MKKALVVALSLGLIVGSLLAPEAIAKKKKGRVFTGTYENPAPGVGGVITLNGQGGQVTSPALAGERFLDVEVIDDSGRPVYFTIANQDTDGDGSGEIVGRGCGKTSDFPITPGYTYNISVLAGPGLGGLTCVGPATSGKIRLTFKKTL